MRFSDRMGAGRGKAVRSNVFAGGKPRPEEERSDDAFQSDSDLSERSDPRRSATTMRFRATATFRSAATRGGVQ